MNCDPFWATLIVSLLGTSVMCNIVLARLLSNSLNRAKLLEELCFFEDES